MLTPHQNIKKKLYLMYNSSFFFSSGKVSFAQTVRGKGVIPTWRCLARFYILCRFSVAVGLCTILISLVNVRKELQWSLCLGCVGHSSLVLWSVSVWTESILSLAWIFLASMFPPWRMSIVHCVGGSVTGQCDGLLVCHLFLHLRIGLNK